MPPRSLAALAVTRIPKPVPIPDPPPGLTGEEASLWRSILVSKSSDWFDQASLPLLECLVRSISMHRRLCEQIDRFDPANSEHLGTLNKLLAMRDREGKALASVATKLRLTIQSRYTPERAKTIALRGGRVPRAWDVEANPFEGNGIRRPE